jgi:hypothetical protein
MDFSASRQNDAANAGGRVRSQETHRRGVRDCRYLELAWSAGVTVEECAPLSETC